MLFQQASSKDQRTNVNGLYDFFICIYGLQYGLYWLFVVVYKIRFFFLFFLFLGFFPVLELPMPYLVLVPYCFSLSKCGFSVLMYLQMYLLLYIRLGL